LLIKNLPDNIKTGADVPVFPLIWTTIFTKHDECCCDLLAISKWLFFVEYPIACSGDRNFEDFASLFVNQFLTFY